MSRLLDWVWILKRGRLFIIRFSSCVIVTCLHNSLINWTELSLFASDVSSDQTCTLKRLSVAQLFFQCLEDFEMLPVAFRILTGLCLRPTLYCIAILSSLHSPLHLQSSNHLEVGGRFNHSPVQQLDKVQEGREQQRASPHVFLDVPAVLFVEEGRGR